MYCQIMEGFCKVPKIESPERQYESGWCNFNQMNDILGAVNYSNLVEPPSGVSGLIRASFPGSGSEKGA